MTSAARSQVDLIHEELRKGPRTAAELIAAGINPVKLTARLRDLRIRLQQRGCDWRNDNGTYVLVVPE